MVAYQLSTGEVSGSNPSKCENFSIEISNLLNPNLNGAANACALEHIWMIVRKWSIFNENPSTGTVQRIQLEGVPTSQRTGVLSST